MIICYTPEAAQVSATASAVDAHGLLLEATTGDGSIKLAPQVLAIRIENTSMVVERSGWMRELIGPARPVR